MHEDRAHRMHVVYAVADVALKDRLRPRGRLRAANPAADRNTTTETCVGRYSTPRSRLSKAMALTDSRFARWRTVRELATPRPNTTSAT